MIYNKQMLKDLTFIMQHSMAFVCNAYMQYSYTCYLYAIHRGVFVGKCPHESHIIMTLYFRAYKKTHIITILT